MRIQFDGLDVGRLMVERLQHVSPATGTQDQSARDWPQVIGQRRGQLIKVGQPVTLSVIAGDDRQAVTVGKHTQLWWWLGGGIETQAGRMPQRDGGTLHHTQQAQRTGVLRNHTRISDTQHLAEALVGGYGQGAPVVRQQQREQQ